MTLKFYKYHGTGNDFILIDDRKDRILWNQELIAELCHRRFGIGADGLMLLKTSQSCDFRMIYYNSDGREGSMCGNGGRCITAFARELGLIKDEAIFEAIDGSHKAMITGQEKNETHVKVMMGDVARIERENENFFLDTGSPHFIRFVTGLKNMDVVKEGRAIRNSERFRMDGTNVDFAEIMGDRLFVRSYERGVEDETLSCGTGVTAAAIAWSIIKPEFTEALIDTLGGALKVSFQRKEEVFTDVWLEGPAVFVYKGKVRI